MTLSCNAKYRPLLMKLYHAGLKNVAGHSCVYDYFDKNQVLRTHCSVISIGKAAVSMAQGTEQYFGNLIQAGLVITKYGHQHGNTLPENWRIVEAGHPVPDANSLSAGEQLIDFISNLSPAEPVYILLSGGASSLVEHLPDAITLQELQSLTEWMLENGKTIHEMNRCRQAISLLKGGSALGYFSSAHDRNNISQLIISDVPDDDLSIIGSGMFTPTNLDVITLQQQLPKEYQALLGEPLPASENKQSIKSVVIANNSVCREFIENAASELKLTVFNHAEILTDDITVVANHIMQTLQKGDHGIYIWGAEPTVTLPEHFGRGGRNQHLALLLAQRIAQDPQYYILCAGTDGSDGQTDAAGAIVDSETILRGNRAGLDAAHAITTADSGNYLAETGDLLDTGPSGTNVMDIIIALKVAPGHNPEILTLKI